MNIHRGFVAIGGLIGAAGIASYAAAAHSPSGHIATIAPMLLIHAPVFLALSPLARINRAALLGGLILALGLLLFVGDLFSRDLTGARAFAFAAPLGGSLLIIGWLGIAATAFRALDFQRGS